MARRAKKGEAEFLAQCRALGDHWDAIDPTRIGMSEAAVDGFVEKSQAARQAFLEADRARRAYEAALLRKRLTIADLRQSFGASTATIDAFAKATRNRGVYAIARLDPPEKPGKRSAPPAPKMRTPRLLGYGPIELSFTPSGEAVQYEVQRSVLSLDSRYSPWELLTITGHKRVRDRKVPRGVAAVRYRVRARRTTGKTSDWSTAAEVSFGCRAGACAVLGGVGEDSGGGGERAA